MSAAVWLARAALGFLVPLLAGLWMDWLFDLPAGVRAVPLGLSILLPCLSAVGLGILLLRREDAERLAGEIDRAHGRCRDGMRSVLNLLARASRSPAALNPFMLRKTVAAAESSMAGVDPARYLRLGRRRYLLAGILPLLLLLAAMGLVGDIQLPLLSRRFFDPFGNYPRPSRTRIRVSAEEQQTVTQGEDLTVEAELSGVVPATPSCFLHLMSERDPEQVIPMAPRPDLRFVSNLKNLSKSLTFWVTAADGRSQRYTVQVVPRPRVVSMEVDYRYPRYTKLPASRGPLKIREFKAVAGTKVNVSFLADQPIKDSWVKILGKKGAIRWDRERQEGRFTFLLERSGKLEIHLMGDNDTVNKYDPPYVLKAIPDQPPQVSFMQLPEGLVFYPDDLLRFTYRGTDDFGLEEVFIRHKSPDERELNSLTLDFPHPGQKELEAEAVIEIRDLIDRGPYSAPANDVEFSLVMADGKEQEGSTQKVRLRVLSETPDRQLRELNDWLTDYGSALDRLSETLRAQAGQLRILVDSMDESTKASDRHRQMLGGILYHLRGLYLPDPLRYGDRHGTVYQYGIYPYPAGHDSEELMTNPQTFLLGADYVRILEDIARQEKPFAGLKTLQATLAAQVERLDPFREALWSSVQENEAHIVSALVDQYQNELLRAEAKQGTAAAKVSREKQTDRLAEIAKALGNLESRGAGDLSAPRQEILDASREGAAASPADGLASRLRSSLKGKSLLRGDKRKPLQEWIRRYPLADRLEKAEGQPEIAKLAAWLMTKTSLRADNGLVNEAELLLDIWALQSLLAARDKADRDTVARIRSWGTWAKEHDLYDRVRRVRVALREWTADLETGRLSRDGATLLQRWLELREGFCGLLSDLHAGTFDSLDGDILKRVRGLEKQEDLFERWYPALIPADFTRRSVSLDQDLLSLAGTLEPRVFAGLDRLRPELMTFLDTVSASLKSEAPRVREEVQALAREVQEAGMDHLVPIGPDRKTSPATVIRSAKPERVIFSSALVRRLCSYGLAAGKAIDFEMLAWARRPSDMDGMDWLKAAENISEFLRYFEEQTYDKAVGPHHYGQFIERTYPGYLLDIQRYLDGAARDAEQVASELSALARRNVKPLLESQDFQRRMLRINQQRNYRQTVEWLETHRDFRAKLADSSGPRDRIQDMLNVCAQHPQHPAAYWRSVYQHLSRATQTRIALLEAGPQPDEALAQVRASITAIQNATKGLNPFPPELNDVAALAQDLNRVEKAVRDVLARKSTSEEKQDVQDEVDDWRGKLLAIQEGVFGRLASREVQFRRRQRYGSKPRMDLAWTINRILRTEAEWQYRVNAEEERVVAGHVELLETLLRGQDGMPFQNQADWQISHLIATRRRSVNAQTQRSRGLPWETDEATGRQPKLPAYLYEELRRALRKNYPKHFRELGLQYIRGLSQDSF